ncbi:MAG: MarC family protein [Microbacteriaceae bacterium]
MMKFSSDVTTLIALFAIVNPITAIPVFLALGAKLSAAQQRMLALKVAVYAGITLVVAYFLGGVILATLSIELDAFRIAGALVIASFGWSMTNGKAIEMPDENLSGAAVVPLAIPIMAGPGAIATVIALGNAESGIGRVTDLIVIAALTVMTFLFLLLAKPIEKALGKNGLMVVSRVLGLLLLAIAVSTILSALGSAFPGLAI